MSKNVATHIATVGEAGGWENVWGPSKIPFAEGTYPDPVEMGDKDIEELKKAWGEATVRSDEAGEKISWPSAVTEVLTNFTPSGKFYSFRRLRRR